MSHPPEPTGEQCSARAPVTWADRTGKAQHGFAIWYPQMGGYVGRAVVLPPSGIGADGSPISCFEAWVWHDGEFPFNEQDDEGRSPAYLHHCDAEQFIRFGNEVKALASRPPRGDAP